MFVRKNFCESCEQYHGYTPTEGFCAKQQCARFNTDEAPASCFEQINEPARKDNDYMRIFTSQFIVTK